MVRGDDAWAMMTDDQPGRRGWPWAAAMRRLDELAKKYPELIGADRAGQRERLDRNARGSRGKDRKMAKEPTHAGCIPLARQLDRSARIGTSNG